MAESLIKNDNVKKLFSYQKMTFFCKVYPKKYLIQQYSLTIKSAIAKCVNIISILDDPRIRRFMSIVKTVKFPIADISINVLYE